MSKPKAPKEGAQAKAARLAEEERIRIMKAKADADEFAAGRQFLTRRTRQVMRLFGARKALAGVGGATPAIGGGTAAGGGAGGSIGGSYGGDYGDFYPPGGSWKFGGIGGRSMLDF